MAASEGAAKYLAQNRQGSLYASSTIPFFFAMIAVVLRFWCRRHKQAGFWLDDWLILAALMCGVGLSTVLLWCTPRALGRHIQTFGPNATRDFSIGLFTAEVTYTGVVVFVKLAILALYWRIFNRSSIRLPIAILSTAVSMWGIAAFLMALLQCIPTRGLWDKTIKASCKVDVQKSFLAISIPNIVIDILLLFLPIPYIKRLNVPKDQKKALMSIFLLGGFVCVASVMRLVTVLTETIDADVSWNFVSQAIWAVTEADFAIIGGEPFLYSICASAEGLSACLPTLRPFWLVMKELKTRLTTQLPRPTTIGSPGGKRKHTWRSSTRAQTQHDDEILFSTLPRTRNGYEDKCPRESGKAATTITAPPPVYQDTPRSQGRISVESAWDVGYDQRNIPRYELGV
ncbi:hypothetical protein K461DRAFT_114435 [Myriangium duriaei CBS 260.36]|uniref:Rhodopsin domain-containing protein n=1 Tax=Myriangium duriaei CBS 260.36 TaxID=1168546 RepID=A0A9P4J1D1_9PEZI|nr:hypothetical protein K461DRAFT_114435 [Myriangium duriaei CBS 260.36]